MTIRKKPIALQEQARLLLEKYEALPNVDMNHPAVQAMRNLAENGVLFNNNEPALEDLFLRMRSLAIRSSGKSYDETLEILANSMSMSESTVGRKIKRKPTMPPEIQVLSGADSLLKFLFHAAQVKLPEKVTVKRSRRLTVTKKV